MSNFWENDPEVTSDKGASDFWANDPVVTEEKPKKGPIQADENAPDFTRGAGNIFPQIQSTYGAAKALTGVAAQKLGFEDTGKEWMKSGLEHMEKGEAATIVKPTDELVGAWEKGGAGAILTDWLPYQMGAGVGNLAETLGFMAIGAVSGAGVASIPTAIAGAVGRNLIKDGIISEAQALAKKGAAAEAKDLVEAAAKKEVSAWSRGATAGMAAQSTMHGLGEVGGRAFEEGEKRGERPEDVDLARVLPAAAGHALADFVAEKIMLGAFKPATKEVKNGLAAEIGKRILTTGTEELGPEEVQTLAERWGAKLSLTDAEAIRDYINTAGASYAMSVIPGIGGGIRSKLSSPVSEDKTKTTEDKIIKAGEKPAEETTTEAELPPFTPVKLPDGTTATSQADLDAYNQNPAATTPEATTPEATTPEAVPEKPSTAVEQGFAPVVQQKTEGETAEAEKEAIAGGFQQTKEEEITLDEALKEVEGQKLPKVSTPALKPAEQKAIDYIGAIDKGETPTLEQAVQVAEGLGVKIKREEGKPVTLQEINNLLRSYVDNLKGVATQDFIYEYDAARKELAAQEEPINLPEWTNLDSDEKDFLVSRLRTNASAADYTTVLKELADYKESQGRGAGYGQEKITPTEQIIVNGYDEQRNEAYEKYNVNFPHWDNLPPEAKKVYTDIVTSNAPAQQDAALKAVQQVLQTQGVSVLSTEREQLRQREAAAQKRAQEEDEKRKAQEAEAMGKGEPLTKKMRDALTSGDYRAINAVLQMLAGEAQGTKVPKTDKTTESFLSSLADTYGNITAGIYRYLARTLSTMTFNSAVITDINNPVIQRLRKEGKLAEYSPKDDTFYFTPEGMDEATVLHEVVHAGTVKLIHQYLTDPSSLPPLQREALDHLQKIFNFTKGRLGGKYKNAYENLYEFVSYALTDPRFQGELANIQSKNLSKYSSMSELGAAVRNAWYELTRALANLYGLVTGKGKTLQVRPELVPAFSEGMSPTTKETFYENIGDLVDEQGLTQTEVGEFVPGKQTEVTEKEQGFKVSKSALLSREKGFEGNLLLEVSEIFNQILAVPEAGIDVSPLAAAAAGAAGKAPQQTKKAPTQLRTGEIGIDKDAASDAEYEPSEKIKGRESGYWRKLFTTAKGWQHIATLFQNDRYPIKSWQDNLDSAKAIVYDLSKKFNNVYTHIVLSSGRAKDLYERHVAGPAEALNSAINSFAKATGLDLNKALIKLHMIMETLHEPERRAAKYIMIVPLDNKAKVVRSNGKLITAADRRTEILGDHEKGVKGELDNPNLTAAQARQLRVELNYLTDVKNGHVSETGYSPEGKLAKDGSITNIDINNRVYNVVGVDPATVQARLDEIKNSPYRAEIDAVSTSLKDLHDATKMLDTQSNYWSKPVSNRAEFYGFKNYIPLKGKAATKADEMLDFTSKRMGSEVQKPQGAMGGRESVADNPILQSMSDATRSALRAGRKNITQAIINAIDQGLLPNFTYDKKPVPFEERYSIESDENTIFHYAENGEITVIKFTGESKNNSLLNSIRRTYKAVNPLVNVANNITSMIGQFHTRYNYAFGPMNFVRDILTNAFTMGVKLGPMKSLAFIGDISAQVANGGLGKAMQVAALYARRDHKSIANLAKNDPFVKNMVDYITEGGLVTYIEGIALKSNFQALHKEIGRSGILKTKDQIDKFVDIWTNMFELASRASAYGVAKSSFMADNMDEKTASTKAAAYAKDLANFEQVGQLGKTMGAFYMFFRPAATGAVRAIEALAPALRSVESAMQGLPQSIQIGATPEARVQRDAFIKDYKEQQKNARIMAGSLFGLGMMAYFMSAAMSPDDELGRNKTKTDNMQQWSRYARFHLPDGLGLGKDVVFQIPWGFGLGAFAASGAQIAAILNGKSTMADAAANIALQISLDSFIPIPVSKMNPTEDPLNFALDSIAPSTVRPILEFALNKNGLGQSIYNDSNRRIGDAYVGGDNIPQIYKDLSRKLAQTTSGAIDWNPNSLYFLANSYADGVSRLAETGYGLSDLARGRKEFNAKTDLPLANSFFGTRSNVDSREFTSVEKQILAKEQKINMFKGDPEAMMRYYEKFPMDEAIVKQFNTMVNGELKRLRTEAKNFRLMEGLSPKERESIVKMITLQQNLIKHNIIETFKAYDIKP